MDRDQTTRSFSSTLTAPLPTSGSTPQPLTGRQNVSLPDARCKYVATKAYRAVKQVLEDEGRVLVCGSPGSGKTYMANILLDEYRGKGYEVIFPNQQIRKFNLHNYTDDNPKLFLVLDDIFGRFTANTSEIAYCFQLLDEIEEQFRYVQNLNPDGRKTIFKVLFSSRTDIYLDVERRLKRYKLFLLRLTCIINLSIDRETKLSQDERKSILKAHLQHAGVSMSDQDIDCISGMDFKTLGFPCICKMFVNRKTSSINAKTFFKEPLDYLDVDVSRMFHETDNLNQMMKAAVLLLLVLMDGSFNLGHLKDPGSDTFKCYYKLHEVLRLPPIIQSLPSELTNAATALIGTYLTCDRDDVAFSHHTIHDAVAYVMGNLSKEFVLLHCTLQFIVERVVVRENVVVSDRHDHSKVIMIGESYIRTLLQRLAKEIIAGRIALSLSHQALLQEDIFEQLVDELKWKRHLEDVIHKRDAHSDGLSFLFWASYTGIWKNGFLDILLNPTFGDDEYLEAYLSSCIGGNVHAFKELGQYVGNLNRKLATATLSDIAHGAEEKMLTCNLTEKREKNVVSRRHDRKQDHLIHIASANGHVAIVNMLTDMGIHINDEGGMGMTPLMYGSYFGHYDLVELLLMKGADTKMMNDDNDNCLHLAVRGGFTNIVKLLLQKMDPNCRGRYDRTPLMYAAYDGYKDLVNVLINQGAKLQPEQTKRNKNNSLHEACVNNRREVVELLLDTYHMDIECTGEKGRTPLLAASRGGNLEVVKVLISRNAVTEVLDDSGYNCLHLASMIGDIDTVTYFLDEEDFDIESKGSRDYTPIMCCVLGNHRELFKFFLQRGATVDVQDTASQTSVHYAAMNGNLEIVQILESRGLQIDSRGFIGRTPIMLACRFGHENVFTYLKGKGANLISKDQNHANSLHLACIGKNAEIVQALIDMNIVDINERDVYQSTPLRNAVKSDYPYLIDLLINHGARVSSTDFDLLNTAAKYGCGKTLDKLLKCDLPINLRSRRKKTPLMIACQNGHTDVVKQILDILPSQINDKDDTGCTVFHFAASSNIRKLLRFLISKCASFKEQNIRGESPLHSAASAGAERSVMFFLEKGIQIDARDHRGNTPLMAVMILSEDNTDVVKVLMESGADVNVVNMFGDTLLHAAAKSGAHVNCVHQILKAPRLNINQKDNDGNTPIMISAKHGKLDMFKILHSRRASLHVINNRGETILHVACMSKYINYSIIEELIKNGLSPDSKDDKGKTPELHIASYEQRQVVVDIFNSQEQSVIYERH